MIRKLLIMLGASIFLGISYLAYINRGALIGVKYLRGVLECDIFILIITVMILSVAATFFIFQGSLIALQDKMRKQSRKVEKAGIIKEESEDKISLLEAKIQTLEKALSDALKRN